MLVTGAAGLLGRAVCARLSSEQQPVIATHRSSDPGDGLAEVMWARTDLREAGSVDGMGELSAVVHLAAVIPGGSRPIEDQAAENRAIDDNVFTAAVRRGIPVVYASTGALYAEPLPATGWSESGPISPVGPYLEEKAWAEARGATLAEEAGFELHRAADQCSLRTPTGRSHGDVDLRRTGARRKADHVLWKRFAPAGVRVVSDVADAFAAALKVEGRGERSTSPAGDGDHATAGGKRRCLRGLTRAA